MKNKTKKFIALGFVSIGISFLFLFIWLWILATIGVPIKNPAAYKDEAFLDCAKKLNMESTYEAGYEKEKKDRTHTMQFATNGYQIVTFTQDMAITNQFNARVRKTVVCTYDIHRKKTKIWISSL